MAANSFSGGHGHNRNQEATVWVGGLEPQCSDELLWELFTQVGPVTDVSMPRDKVTGVHQNYGFVEFASAEDCDYVIRIMNGVRLHGKPIRVNKVMAAKTKEIEVFANLFIGNLDPEVDEKVLYDTFSAFGLVLQAKVMTDPDTSKHKGFGFINFDSFDVADQAIAAMHGQYLNGRPIQVSYAYKKDGTKGERHGTAEERLLASKRTTTAVRPNAAGMMSMTAAAAGGPPKLPPMPMQSSMMAPPPMPMSMPPPPMMGGYPMNGGGMMPPMPPPMPFGGFGMGMGMPGMGMGMPHGFNPFAAANSMPANNNPHNRPPPPPPSAFFGAAAAAGGGAAASVPPSFPPPPPPNAFGGFMGQFP